MSSANPKALPPDGGGYRYALAPRPSGYTGNLELTEELFNNMTLKFVGNVQWIQDNVRRNRTQITAVRTTEGTHPPGSEWTKVPVPECITARNTGGGDLSPCLGFQYAPPCYNCYGQFGDPSNKVWHAAGRDDAAFDMSIVDKIQVPKNIVSRQTLLLFVRAG